jgi:hypothetical protein
MCHVLAQKQGADGKSCASAHNFFRSISTTTPNLSEFHRISRSDAERTMNEDISEILNAWPGEPGKVNCRMITGRDGLPKVQVRLDVGILQMNADGRPDGLTPHGFPSFLDYINDRMEAELSAGSEKSELTPEECRLLREEADMYTRRLVAMFILEDFERVIRDATRNLHLLDLLAEHGAPAEDRAALESQRPYLLTMRTRAIASLAIRQDEPKAALFALDEGLRVLRRHFDEAGQPQLFEKSQEVQLLKEMRDALVPRLPVSQKAELRERLARAIAEENYELAAILREELKLLKE